MSYLILPKLFCLNLSIHDLSLWNVDSYGLSFLPHTYPTTLTTLQYQHIVLHTSRSHLLTSNIFKHRTRNYFALYLLQVLHSSWVSLIVQDAFPLSHGPRLSAGCQIMMWPHMYIHPLHRVGDGYSNSVPWSPLEETEIYSWGRGGSWGTFSRRYDLG